MEVIVDKNCKKCKGKGLIWVEVGGEAEKELCDCAMLIFCGICDRYDDEWCSEFDKSVKSNDSCDSWEERDV